MVGMLSRTSIREARFPQVRLGDPSILVQLSYPHSHHIGYVRLVYDFVKTGSPSSSARYLIPRSPYLVRLLNFPLDWRVLWEGHTKL